MDTHNDDTVTLREYFDMRLAALESELDQRMEASQTAIDKAEAAMTLRLAGMNEIRDTLNDQAQHFATRAGLDALRDAREIETRGVRNELSARIDGVSQEIKGITKQLWLLVGAASVIQILVLVMLQIFLNQP